MARPAPTDAEHFSKTQIARGAIIAGHLTTMPAHAEADFSIRDDERPEMRRLVSAILTNELTREPHSREDFERIKKLTEKHDLLDVGAMIETYEKLFDDADTGRLTIDRENLRSFGKVFLIELLPPESASVQDLVKMTLTAFAGINLKILSEKVSKEFRQNLLTGCKILGPGELHFQRPKSFDGDFEVENKAGEKVKIQGDLLLDLYIDALTQIIEIFTSDYVDYAPAMPKVVRNGRNFKIQNFTPPFATACLNSAAMAEPKVNFEKNLSRHVDEILAEKNAQRERHRRAEEKAKRREENRKLEAEAEERKAAKEALKARIAAEQKSVKERVITDAKILEAARIERENKEEVQRQQKEIRDRVATDAEKRSEEERDLRKAKKDRTMIKEDRSEDESRYKFAGGAEPAPILDPEFMRDVRAIVEEDEKSKDR